MIIQDRDVKLIRAIDKCQFLNKQLIRSYFNLFPGNENTVARRLKKLEEHGYLGKVLLLDERNRLLNYIYFLKKKGYHLIDKPVIRRSIPKNLFLTHTMRLIEAGLIFRRMAFRADISIKWMDERQTNLDSQGKRYKAVQDRFISYREGREVNLIPDGVMTLKIGQYTMLYFVELDNGTETIRKQLASKFLKYLDYFGLEGEPFMERYKVNVPNFRVLFITQSQKRIANIFETLQHIGNYNFILFTTLENLKKADSFSSQVWQKRDQKKIIKTAIVKP